MIVLKGTDAEKFYSWPLGPGIYIIGRIPECELVISHKTVSRRHAQIEVATDGLSCMLTDLGSHNGTSVNGEKISAPATLKIGDSILFGQTEFQIAESDRPDSGMPPSQKTILAQGDLQHSIMLPMDEAMRPLPRRASDLPDLMPTLLKMAKMTEVAEDQNDFLMKSLNMVSHIIPAERYMVLFMTDDNADVYIGASLLPGSSEAEELQLSRSIINEIISNKSALVIADAMGDPRFSEKKSIMMSELKSAMAVPLFDEGKVLGILYTDTRNPLHSYNDDYLRVFALFGNIIAARLLNYSLLAERQAREVLDAELKKAAAIQKNLLITSWPEIEGYSIDAFLEQSRSVGGDLYDIRRLKDGRLLIMIGDVSGKGMGAALLMSNILAAFRILYDQEGFDLGAAVGKVSGHLCEYNKSNNFATLFIGLLDSRNHTLSYINAGHNPPLLVSSEGERKSLEATGLMIGAFDFASWKVCSLELHPGDLLYMFSDGVTEADRSGCGDQFSDERLEKLVLALHDLAPKEMNARIVSEINAFMGTAPRSDDITMIALKRG